MPRIAMEPAGAVVARVRGMSLARNVGPKAPAVNFMTQCGLLPAVRAVRVDPIAVMRTEKLSKALDGCRAGE
jgi:hypothetical protein